MEDGTIFISPTQCVMHIDTFVSGIHFQHIQQLSSFFYILNFTLDKFVLIESTHK